jgi:putative transposase
MIPARIYHLPQNNGDGSDFSRPPLARFVTDATMPAMPRRKRLYTGGLVCHVLNRAAGRKTIFHRDADYAAFEQLLTSAGAISRVRLLTFCLMPNHWHLVLWPQNDGDLSTYMHWLTMTHTMRWHRVHQSLGTGPLYQGRFKSFPVSNDHHFLTVCRYVERNALRAGLVERAEQWRWSGLWHREHRGSLDEATPWPVPAPSDWVSLVNQPQTQAELDSLRRSLRRGTPYGGEAWAQATADRLGMSLRNKPRGRPRGARRIRQFPIQPQAGPG